MEQPRNIAFDVIGIKPNPSYFHNTMRIVVLFLLVFIIFIIYYSDTKPNTIKTSEDDIHTILKPGTKMHDIVMDMDEDARTLYVSSMTRILQDNHEASKMRKVMGIVLTALFVNFVTEYIIHGNIGKIVGTVSKTGLAATLTAIT